jgi:hypothetical protein
LALPGVGVGKLPLRRNVQNSGAGNALELEKIAYNASWRNFSFANLARKGIGSSASFRGR